MEAHHSTDVPWWKVLFLQNETIREVYVLTKTDRLQYFPNFEVSVEFVPKENEDDFTYMPEYKHTCYQHDDTVPDSRHDLDPDTDPDTSMIYVQCDQPEVGNQVRIQLAEIESQLVLCDVRISKECPGNKWGPLCENSCGACRISTCDVITGTCYGGCQDGFDYTDRCTAECIDVRFGYRCQSVCNVNCMSQPCNKVNGECIGGCKAGYRGNRCEQECMDGTYGIGCNNVCSVHCANVCNKVTGTCSCKIGYKGMFCDEECDRGTYGTDCTSQCNSKCPNTCDKVTGHCSECPLGWKGHYCETECDYGTYGLNCTAECGYCQTNTFCHKVTGICESGCMKGYTGATCHDAKADPTPLPIATIAGTSVGVVVIICATVIVVCFVMYKRRQPQPTVNTTMVQMEPVTNSISSSYSDLQRNDKMNDTTYEAINP